MFRSVAQVVAEKCRSSSCSEASVTKVAYEGCVEEYLEVSVERLVRSSEASLKAWLDNLARVDEMHIPKAILCIRVRGFYQVFFGSLPIRACSFLAKTESWGHWFQITKGPTLDGPIKTYLQVLPARWWTRCEPHTLDLCARPQQADVDPGGLRAR